MATHKPLVIVGASYAGLQLAASARELGFEERIVVIGDEPHVPYQRPPLSKGLLTGKTTVDKLSLRGPNFFEENRIELMLGCRVDALDAGARKITFHNGGTLDYAWLALTTGARCRPLTLPGADLHNVFSLRTLDDALRIDAAAGKSRRACIIGGGFIGLEVAAALVTRGLQVTVVEAQPRLLMRSFPPSMSAYMEDAHRRRGVELMTGCGVRALLGVNGDVQAVVLSDGRQVECDLVVLGIGVMPNVELAAAAGIATRNGILVDALGRTSAPQVLAIGDVANVAFSSPAGDAQHLRLESIQAANDGARAASTLLVDSAPPAHVVPWFWSEQFDLKLQMAGLPVDSDEVVVRGDMATDRFSVYYLRHGALVASHSVNRPSEHMHSRKLIAAGAQPTAQQLADDGFDLKTVPFSASATA